MGVGVGVGGVHVADGAPSNVYQWAESGLVEGRLRGVKSWGCAAAVDGGGSDGGGGGVGGGI